MGVPVIAVCGTSSQQGKFTLQVGLRRAFIARGYRVGQLGTEHHAALFGMEVTFPNGYAAPADLPLRMYPPYIDACLRSICADATPDLLLVGTQSGSIPYGVYEPSTLNMSTTPFLLGAKPDACVLVVNSIDPGDYIADTIDAIRAVVKCPTVALALSDKEKHIREAYGASLVTPRQMDEATITHHTTRLSKRFEMPVCRITNSHDVDRLCDRLIAHFELIQARALRRHYV